MAHPTTGADGASIFLNYRREDTRHLAGRLYDRLADRFGDDRIFMDVASIEPGADFAVAIEAAVARCGILLVLIGPHWLDARDEHGHRRLDDVDDLVVLEIAAALDRDVRVLPVLVDGAAAPHRSALPPALAPLARRSAMRLDHETFRSDGDALLGAVATLLDRGRGTSGRPATTPGTGPSSWAVRGLPDRPDDLRRAEAAGRVLVTVRAERSRALLRFTMTADTRRRDGTVPLGGRVTESGTDRSLPAAGTLHLRSVATTLRLTLTLTFGEGRIVAERDVALPRGAPGQVGTWASATDFGSRDVALRGRLTGGVLKPEDVTAGIRADTLTRVLGAPRSPSTTG